MTNFAPYDKINGLFKRDERGKFIPGEFAQDEFEFLFDNPWTWTEKVDGTNIRLGWEPGISDASTVAYIAGRSDNAQIPPFLLQKLVELHQDIRPSMDEKFAGAAWVTLYGEGYGAKIQGCGGNYNPDGQDFVLFDVAITGLDGVTWWMKRSSVVDIAEALQVDVVPLVATCSVRDGIALVAGRGFTSGWPGVDQPEGLVGRPAVDLWDRAGRRVTTKLKWKDLKDFDLDGPFLGVD